MRNISFQGKNIIDGKILEIRRFGVSPIKKTK